MFFESFTFPFTPEAPLGLSCQFLDSCVMQILLIGDSEFMVYNLSLSLTIFVHLIAI